MSRLSLHLEVARDEFVLAVDEIIELAPITAIF